MVAPDRSPDDKSTDAEALFSEFLRLKQAEGISFEEFCQRHPERKLALEVLNSIQSQSEFLDDDESVEQILRNRFPTPEAEGDDGTLSEGDTPTTSRAASAGDDSILEIVDRLGRDEGRRYETRGEIARGGMGIILSVWDRDLQRVLAKKVIRRDRGDPRTGNEWSKVPSDHLARFLEEAQVTAQLDHPGIVPVHEVGIDKDGQVFFTMKMVQGRELKEIVASARAGEEDWNLSRALGVVIKVCQALAYAHSKGVIHRDLKPANVMVGAFGEVYVMDWGLAKILGKKDRHDVQMRREQQAATTAVRSIRSEHAEESPDSPLLTADGTVVGTPAYMSPEQAAGRIEEVDALSDLYSVGAILYTLLTGRIPYVPPDTAVSPRTILASVLARPPESIDRVSPEAPSEVVAICEKAMARSKPDRYSGCLEMGEDLQAYLDGRVVRAYETGAGAEFRKWVQRNRGMAISIASAIVLTIVGLLTIMVIEIKAKAKVLRLSDVTALKDYVAEADALWPCVPEKADAMQDWLGKAGSLVERLPQHHSDLETLEGQVLAYEETKPPQELKWQRDTLSKLVDDLTVFADPDSKKGMHASVKERFELAETIEAKTVGGEYVAVWEDSVRSIADETRFPIYRGFRMIPQIGLIPLGPDPKSGLWEFAHYQTGSVPGRGPDGKLELTEDSSLVFVLLPGGTFRMGAWGPPTDDEPPRSDVDPDADKDESPVRDVTLEPFLISKYEMTQGQWLRFTGDNPSEYAAGFIVRDKARQALYEHTLSHPIENVSLKQGRVVLWRLGLALPTEAQWEYAARGGKTTRWSTGDTVQTLQGAVNVADLTYHKVTEGVVYYEDLVEDGYGRHAPVGSFAPNDFALHDTMGNVWEWVRDRPLSYELVPRPGDGERVTNVERPITDNPNGLFRGGSWLNNALACRVSNRYAYKETNQDGDTGFRPIFSIRVD